MTRAVSEPGAVLEDATIQSLDATQGFAPETQIAVCVRLVMMQGGLRSTC